MAIKVLLLNFPRTEIYKSPSNIELVEAKLGDNITLHDFHVVILDAEEILQPKWFKRDHADRLRLEHEKIERLKTIFKEQIETGGITFCFASSNSTLEIYCQYGERHTLGSYEWCPIDCGFISEQGDTFYPRFEELKYFNPLFKTLSSKEVYWKCYFSKPPKNSKILATNRAGYSVFMEVPVGNGKLILMPRFKNRSQAVTMIVNDVIPQIVREEEFTFVPTWLPDFSSPLEIENRKLLGEIERAKRLLYTKNRALKNAVAFALEKLGFKAEKLPNGTLPDLRVQDDEIKGIVEVKGHENRQIQRAEVLQLLGYLSETNTKEKAIFIANHEFSQNPPHKRNTRAYTDGAIQLAKANDMALISTADLHNVVLLILEKKIADEELKRIRNKMMTKSGEVKLP